MMVQCKRGFLVLLSGLWFGCEVTVDDSNNSWDTESDTTTDTESETTTSSDTDSESDLDTETNSSDTETGGPAIFESFESGVPPTGWQVEAYGEGSGWLQGAEGDEPAGWDEGQTFTSLDGGFVAYSTYRVQNGGLQDQWLITPAVKLESTETLSFGVASLYSESYGDYLEVLLSTTDDAKGSFNQTLETIFLNVGPNMLWTNYEVDLSKYRGQTVYIAFRENVANNQNEGAVVALDLVEISYI